MLTNAAEEIIDLIDLHKINPLVLATPLGRLLPAIRQWIIRTEARLDAIEKKHEA